MFELCQRSQGVAVDRGDVLAGGLDRGQREQKPQRWRLQGEVAEAIDVRLGKALVLKLLGGADGEKPHFELFAAALASPGSPFSPGTIGTSNFAGILVQSG